MTRTEDCVDDERTVVTFPALLTVAFGITWIPIGVHVFTGSNIRGLRPSKKLKLLPPNCFWTGPTLGPKQDLQNPVVTIS